MTIQKGLYQSFFNGINQNYNLRFFLFSIFSHSSKDITTFGILQVCFYRYSRPIFELLKQENETQCFQSIIFIKIVIDFGQCLCHFPSFLLPILISNAESVISFGTVQTFIKISLLHMV